MYKTIPRGDEEKMTKELFNSFLEGMFSGFTITSGFIFILYGILHFNQENLFHIFSGCVALSIGIVLFKLKKDTDFLD